jgi:sigma-B regulation protein RsbU (phosphoserine phosphatase)
VTLDLKSRWRRLGKIDKTFAVLLVFVLILLVAAPGSAFSLFLEFVVVLLGAWIVLRLSRIGLRKAIWRLRNRLLVTYVLIAVVPILLILALFGLGSWLLAGQFAVYLARSELDRRIAAMQTITDTLKRTDRAHRADTMRYAGGIYSQRYPGLVLEINDNGTVQRWPENSEFSIPSDISGEANGIASREPRYFAWSQSIEGGLHVIAAVPLTRRYLNGMVPGLGDVYFYPVSTRAPSAKANKGSVQLKTQSPAGHEVVESALPSAVNRFDIEVLWGSSVPVLNWDEPGRRKTVVFYVLTRYSAILALIQSQKLDELQGLVPALLLAVGIAFLVVELVSLIIGVSLTRTITGAVHSLYQGTTRVMQGDFSHRIQVSGRDQLADLSKSFNTMTENLERLLAVAKEKERLQAEIAIAREVQEQLYPKAAPLLKTIRVTGVCQPARMVSGDYYDYQKLPGDRLAVAIGDVCGKGISAALLMASIQSAMRMELRACLEFATLAPSTNGLRFSTARMVSELNQQVHATSSPEKFATFFFGLLNEETGILTYTNAGHLPPILIRDGSSSLLDVNGTVVGAFPFSKYEESKVELHSGDLLVCYTDGISEPENEYGEMFGEERMIQLVTKSSDRDDKQIIDSVMDAVRQWTGSPELSDDMTVLLIRKK